MCCARFAFRDRNGPPICFQYLGTELDDRLNTPSMQIFLIYLVELSELSWKYYLGNNYIPGGDNVPIYAAPARANNLSCREHIFQPGNSIHFVMKHTLCFKTNARGSSNGTAFVSRNISWITFFLKLDQQRAHEETIRVLKNGLGL